MLVDVLSSFFTTNPYSSKKQNKKFQALFINCQELRISISEKNVINIIYRTVRIEQIKGYKILDAMLVTTSFGSMPQKQLVGTLQMAFGISVL